MKYKLYTDKRYNNAKEQFLCGRGIPQENIDTWLNASLDNVNS